MEQSGVRRAGWIIAVAATYAVVGRIGLSLAPVAGYATLVWPPSGVALVALVVGGRSLWPGIALGSFAVNAWNGAPLPVAACIAVGNTLEPVIAAALLRRAGFDPALQNVRDVALLAGVAAALSTIASAAIGVATLAAAGIVTRAGAAITWRAWWLGDATGILLVAPWLATWIVRPSTGRPEGPRVLEALALGALTIAASVAVFGGVLERGTDVRLMYLLFPPLVWSALRFGQRGATATMLIVSAIAVAGTARGHGPFGHGELSTALFGLQSFMAIVALALLVLGAAIAERDRSRRLALEAVRARDDFLSIASHELRTPLAALVLQLGSLRRRLARSGDDAPAAGIARAEEQADRLEHLIQNLLDVSRSEAGQLEIRPEPIDLAALVRGVVDRAAEQAAGAGCELRARLPEHAEGVWDRLRLEQVLTNLLSNAFRHAAGHPVEVTLELDATRATVSVRDHGPGIAPDELAHIFERYHRGRARTEEGGLGLGLFIARRLVEAHGGSIRVESRLGGGSVFVIGLPRSPDGR